MSAYLDIIRFLAALAVLIGHAQQDGLGGAWMGLGRYSHEAVVVFFVLSGLVIATSTQRPGRGGREYFCARFARIYSVVIPAIVLSFGLAALAGYLDPALPLEHVGNLGDFSANLQRTAASLLFFNEFPGIDTDLPWNQPFWSLCYEVWYYVLFGLYLYTPRPYRPFALAAAAVLAGPAILLLAPIWWLGVLLARHGSHFVGESGRGRAAWLGLGLVLGSWGLLFALADSGWDLALRAYLHDRIPAYWRLESSQRFLTDYLVAILVAVNFVAFRAAAPLFARVLTRLHGMAAFVAGFSFSLYLLHRPMTRFFGHFFPNPESSRVHALLAVSAVLLLCCLLSRVTEQRKDRYQALARWLIDGMPQMLGQWRLRLSSRA